MNTFTFISAEHTRVSVPLTDGIVRQSLYLQAALGIEEGVGYIPISRTSVLRAFVSYVQFRDIVDKLREKLNRGQPRDDCQYYTIAPMHCGGGSERSFDAAIAAAAAAAATAAAARLPSASTVALAEESPHLLSLQRFYPNTPGRRLRGSSGYDVGDCVEDVADVFFIENILFRCHARTEMTQRHVGTTSELNGQEKPTSLPSPTTTTGGIPLEALAALSASLSSKSTSRGSITTLALSHTQQVFLLELLTAADFLGHMQLAQVCAQYFGCWLMQCTETELLTSFAPPAAVVGTEGRSDEEIIDDGDNAQQLMCLSVPETTALTDPWLPQWSSPPLVPSLSEPRPKLTASTGARSRAAEPAGVAAKESKRKQKRTASAAKVTDSFSASTDALLVTVSEADAQNTTPNGRQPKLLAEQRIALLEDARRRGDQFVRPY